MRLRMGDQIYRVRATPVEDPALVREIYNNQVRDRTGAVLTPEKAVRILFFRIDSF
jgi:hypothetical protein